MNRKSDFGHFNDDIYYSMSVYNNGKSGIVEAYYNENRSSPLVINPSLYSLEVLKYTIPTTSIPMLHYQNPVFEKIDNASGGIYKIVGEPYGYIALKYNGTAITNKPTEYKYPVILTNLNEPPPKYKIDYPTLPPYANPNSYFRIDGHDFGYPNNTPQTIQNNHTPYDIFSTKYGLGTDVVFYYQQLLKSINYALNAAYEQAKNDGYTLPTAIPYFSYSNETKLFSLIVSNQYSIDDPGYLKWDIYSNDYIYELFNKIPSYRYSIPGSSPSTLNIKYLIFTEYQPGSSTTFTIQMTQQSSSISRWFQVQNIFLVSDTLSINPVNIGTTTGIPLTLNIISNYYFSFTNSLDYDTKLVYIQQGTKDKIDLLSTQPLYNLNFRLVYQDIFDNIYPILLADYESFELTIKFRKINNIDLQ